MSTTLHEPSTPATRTPSTSVPTSAAVPTGNATSDSHTHTWDDVAAPTTLSRRVAVVGLTALRLAIGFEFLWAFLDKTFGFGYTTTNAKAWIHGGSPTTGFLNGVSAGPFKGIFHGLAGTAAVDWLFMLGLLGVGLALIVGVALRPAAVAGVTMLVMMYLASWPFATHAAGQATGSVNPIVDDHIVSIMGLIVIGALATWGVGFLGRRWAALATVRAHSSLR